MIKKIINYFQEAKVNILSKRKLTKIGRNISINQLDKKLEVNYLQTWTKLAKGPSILYPRYYATISGINSSLYVPENFYYGKIESVLNNKSFALAYGDKNFYERFLAEYQAIFPNTILRGINGNLFDSAYNPVEDSQVFSKVQENTDYILKPATETSGGANVVLISKTKQGINSNNVAQTPEEFVGFLKEKYKGSFVLQEKIKQHSWFEGFNQSSLNTVRLFTYRSVKDESIQAFQAVVRFGKPGSIVDNQAAGGLTCGISKEGKLNDFACEKYGHVFRDIPNIQAKAGQDVPYLDEMKKIASKIAPAYGFQRLLGFDFCVDNKNTVRLLEINCKNIETNFLQMNNGPLFGDRTLEIIDYCSSHRKSVVLDFYI